MGRMTITIEDGLVAQAQAVLGAQSKAEAIRVALQEVIRRARLDRVLEHRGRVELILDPDGLARMREQG
ncbi:MAG: type II toxin-antitoxin system VapB family antitoxin [Deltaproteobacteria bacterium]|nr:type II toxin-antitoxin system VapB family antitoxin [Deltaproteobacteria bacterium]